MLQREAQGAYGKGCRANIYDALQEGAEDAKGVPKVGGRQPQRFVPFTQGARDCVGQTLARLNLSTTLAQLFGSFSFRLAEEVCHPLIGLLCIAVLPLYSPMILR